VDNPALLVDTNFMHMIQAPDIIFTPFSEMIIISSLVLVALIVQASKVRFDAFLLYFKIYMYVI